MTPDRRWPPSKARLERLVAEATLDAYGEAEQRTGFLCSMEEHLELPFETAVLGFAVTDEKVDVTEADEVVAICRRGRASPRSPLRMRGAGGRTRTCTPLREGDFKSPASAIPPLRRVANSMTFLEAGVHRLTPPSHAPATRA